jgi:hypothetical protein
MLGTLLPSPAAVGHLFGETWLQQGRTAPADGSHRGRQPGRKQRKAAAAGCSLQATAAWSLVMGRGVRSLAAALAR